MSTPMTLLTSSSIPALAPELTSSVNANTGWQAICTGTPEWTTAFSADSNAATSDLLSRWRDTA